MKGLALTEHTNLKSLTNLFENKGLLNLLAILNQDGEEARIAGGAVRNALMQESISDVDIATTCLPQEVMKRAASAGFKAVPTGIEHGTVTVVVHHVGYEVTTLRADVRTDGRRAEVAFGRNWQGDANRRDFTINGLYATADGEVIDLVGGLADIKSRTLRFIGDPERRIAEDHLRILRFFRFFAWYGSGRPDSEGLKACVRMKESLAKLSAERVWSELKKLLAAPDPSRALLWMRQAGVLSVVLPEGEKWGIDAIHGLVGTETNLGWDRDPLLRLMAIVPPFGDRIDELASRLKLSNGERERLGTWARAELPEPDLDQHLFVRMLYRGEPAGVIDRLKLGLASARASGDKAAVMKEAGYLRLLEFAQNWRRPVFPVSGADLLKQGVTSGPAVGTRLRDLEDQWLSSDFKLTKNQLLAL